VKNLKKALETNQVADYMLNVSVKDFIKNYESLDQKELKKFININNELVSKDWVGFIVKKIPPYSEN